MSLTKVSYSMINGESVNVKDFGAACDGVTDDTAAVQSAIDYCLSKSPNVTELVIPGLCNITSSINIDRQYNDANTENYFVIRGNGSEGGFYASSDIKIFSSTYADQNFSQNICFENIYFQGVIDNQARFVMNGQKFIRVTFRNCFFKSIRVATTTTYFQSYYFVDCKFKFWSSWVMDCKFFYNLVVSNCQFEGYRDSVNGSKGFNSYDTNSPETSSTQEAVFTNNLFENCTGPFVAIKNGRGVVVSGNYFELIDNAVLDFSQGNPRGIYVSGNSFDTASSPLTYAPILVSYPNGFFGYSNWSSTCLYRFLNEMQMTEDKWGGSWGIGDTPVSGHLLSTTSPISVSSRIPGSFQVFREEVEGQAIQLSQDTNGTGITSINTTSAVYLPVAIKQQNNSTTRNLISADSSGTVFTNIQTSAPTLTDNLTMCFFEATTTQLRITVKGSDGTIRTANITLS